MAKTKTVRQPKAKTAYELLERVCVAIEAHPAAYYQGWWKCTRGGRGGNPPLPHDIVDKNECGTAFCRAGWIVVSNDGNKRAHTNDWYPWSIRAAELIGAEAGDIASDLSRLFASYAIDGAGATPGTLKYARAGIRGIREFMKTHRDHLKARKLRGV